MKSHWVPSFGTIFCPKFHRFSRFHASGKPRSASRCAIDVEWSHPIPRSEWGFSSDIYVYVYIYVYSIHIYILYYILYIYYIIHIYYTDMFIFIERERVRWVGRYFHDHQQWGFQWRKCVRKIPPGTPMTHQGFVWIYRVWWLQMGCFYLAINRIANAV